MDALVLVFTILTTTIWNSSLTKFCRPNQAHATLSQRCSAHPGRCVISGEWHGTYCAHLFTDKLFGVSAE